MDKRNFLAPRPNAFLLGPWSPLSGKENKNGYDGA